MSELLASPRVCFQRLRPLRPEQVARLLQGDKVCPCGNVVVEDVAAAELDHFSFVFLHQVLQESARATLESLRKVTSQELVEVEIRLARIVVRLRQLFQKGTHIIIIRRVAGGKGGLDPLE